jgi:hypothetical protein
MKTSEDLARTNGPGEEGEKGPSGNDASSSPPTAVH